ncbi:MAG: DUF5723 family protein [Chitinophagaceae bacterium]
MKKIQWVMCLLIAGQHVMAQDFPGFRTGNYTGVNSVFFNPANIADSRYRWDVNLVSISTLMGNNQAAFRLKDIGHTLNGDSIKNQIFGDKAGAASGNFNLNIVGPSVMFNTGRKMSFALTTRARAIVNIRDLDGKLANKLVNDFDNDASLPYSINSNNNMQLSGNGWMEFGASVARVLVDKGPHFLKGGITLKYLAGAANAHIYLNQFKGTLNNDAVQDKVYLSNTTGRIGVGFGGANVNDFDAKDLTSFESTGFGGDIGFVYEFRPGYASYKYNDSLWRRDLNKYTLRVGVAILDIGSIKYKKDKDRSGTYDMHVTGTDRFYLNDLTEEDLDSYNAFFKNHSEFFTPATTNADATYKVSLPTTLNLDVDYHIGQTGVYMNLATQIALTKMDNKPYNSQYYSGFTFTPRFESRAFGVFVPVNYNQLTKVNAGISLRAGPVFIGSGSLITALVKDSKQADFHIGIHVGGLQRNKARHKKDKKKENTEPAATNAAISQQM